MGIFSLLSRPKTFTHLKDSFLQWFPSNASISLEMVSGSCGIILRQLLEVLKQGCVMIRLVFEYVFCIRFDLGTFIELLIELYLLGDVYLGGFLMCT